MHDTCLCQLDVQMTITSTEQERYRYIICYDVKRKVYTTVKSKDKIPEAKRYYIMNTVEPLLRGHPFERPPPLERPLDYVNLDINVLISTPYERPPLLKGHFLVQKRWPHKSSPL